MTDKDIKLIERAVTEKWDLIAAGCMDVWFMGEIDSCPLCKKYFLNSCFGCPVAVNTKYTSCVGTPLGDYTDLAGRAQEAKVHDCIEAEIEFLIALLPADHEWRQV